MSTDSVDTRSFHNQFFKRILMNAFHVIAIHSIPIVPRFHYEINWYIFIVHLIKITFTTCKAISDCHVIFSSQFPAVSVWRLEPLDYFLQTAHNTDIVCLHSSWRWHTLCISSAQHRILSGALTGKCIVSVANSPTWHVKIWKDWVYESVLEKCRN
jgi:hypothetical protein